MTTWVTLFVLIALVTAGAIAQPSSAPEAETIWIPTTETTGLGHTRELRLETFLYRPRTPGRVPVLIFNHGSTGGGRVPPPSTYAASCSTPSRRAQAWRYASSSCPRCSSTIDTASVRS